MCNARLISISEAVIGNGNDFMSLSELLAYCEQDFAGDDDNLIRHLVAENRWGPFEVVHASIEVTENASILAHLITFGLFSVNMPDDDGLDQLQMMGADDDNAVVRNVCATALDAYYESLDRGVQKEIAHRLLPLGLIDRTAIISGSIHHWIRYILKVKNDPTLRMHNEIAKQCAHILMSHLPALRVLFRNLVS